MRALTLTAASAEASLCAILSRFETHALSRYQSVAPDVISDDKRALAAALVAHRGKVEPAELARATSDLLGVLTQGDRRETLINQALLLEMVGKAIYAHFGAANISADGRKLCALGASAAATTIDAATRALGAEFETGDALFTAMMDSAPKMFRSLMPFAEALDQDIGPALCLRFADLIGEFIGSLDEAAATLNLDRVKLVGFVANVMMET